MNYSSPAKPDNIQRLLTNPHHGRSSVTFRRADRGDDLRSRHAKADLIYRSRVNMAGCLAAAINRFSASSFVSLCLARNTANPTTGG